MTEDTSIITIVSLNNDYINLSKKTFKYSYNMLIQDYKPKRKKVFYVSPANSLGFMDGGIDKPLSTIMFSGIEKKVKSQIKKYGKMNLLHQKYLPIGSSIIVSPSKQDIFIPHIQDKEAYLVVAPTMLLPQPVDQTQNCYYATMAALYNVFVNGGHRDCEIIFTSMCCGYGYMSVQESLKQFTKACQDFQKYKPKIINKVCILHEPTLEEQPNFYENTAFKKVQPEDIKEKYTGAAAPMGDIAKTMG